MVQAGVVLCEGRPEMIDSEGRTPGAFTSQVNNFVYYTKCSRGTIEGFWGVTYPVFFLKKKEFCVENGLKKARIGS